MPDCKKCGKSFEPQRGLKQYCSLECRNSRTWSEEDKLKRSVAAKASEKVQRENKRSNRTERSRRRKATIHICANENCTNSVYDPRKYCCLKCMHTSSEYKARHSKTTSDHYKSGREVYGGKTKWITVGCSKGSIKVQGTYEAKACIILDYLKYKGIIRNWEYTSDRIGYRDINGKIRTYLLDFKIYDDQGFYYLETKGRVVENDHLKWKAVRESGHRLEIWFEKDVKDRYTVAIA